MFADLLARLDTCNQKQELAYLTVLTGLAISVANTKDRSVALASIDKNVVNKRISVFCENSDGQNVALGEKCFQNGPHSAVKYEKTMKFAAALIELGPILSEQIVDDFLAYVSASTCKGDLAYSVDFLR